MGRALRIDVGNEIYHVLNRANAHITIFENRNDYQALETILEEAKFGENRDRSIFSLIF